MYSSPIRSWSWQFAQPRLALTWLPASARLNLVNDELAVAMQRDLVAVRTKDCTRVVPEAAFMPINKDYMIWQAGLNLNRVIRGILEAGLNLDDAQAA